LGQTISHRPSINRAQVAKPIATLIISPTFSILIVTQVTAAGITPFFANAN
jgi:hypothetical protein